MVALARLSPRVVLLGLTLSACDADVDYVGPGFYGARSAPETQRDPSVPSTGGGAPLSSRTGGATATSGGTTPVATGGTPFEPSPATGGMAMPSASGGSDASPPTPGGGPCDMSGRWLLTFHGATDALGQFQITERWYYYEIAQSGDAFTVTKGLLCGSRGTGLGAFAVSVDFTPAWEGIRKNMPLDGRTGSSVPEGGGCHVRFDRAVSVLSATVPYYLDESVPLPAPEQLASGGMPGVEDWDGDGNPGITGSISGVVTGDIYVTPRQWEEFEATVPSLDSTLDLDCRWNQNFNLVGYDGPPLLTSSAAVSADQELHFAQAHRLADDQALGDDAAICQAVRDLAPSLTPEAATPDALRMTF